VAKRVRLYSTTTQPAGVNEFSDFLDEAQSSSGLLQLELPEQSPIGHRRAHSREAGENCEKKKNRDYDRNNDRSASASVRQLGLSGPSNR
jgi:hypothetical protein